MSDREEDDPAARGALGGRARSTADRHDDDSHRPWRKSDFPSDDAAFERCRVKSHEDFPRHIYLTASSWMVLYEHDRDTLEDMRTTRSWMSSIAAFKISGARSPTL
jgi:hypothetical protein